MPKPNNRGRTRRSGLLIVGIGVLVLLGAAATLVAVVGWQSVKNVFAKDKADPHIGKIAVLVSPVAIPAFTAIDPAMFIDQRTGDFRAQWVSEKVAKDSALVRDPGSIRGRVLNHDKAPGLAFNESDFYPRGTAASWTAAVEPGYRGMHLSTSKVEGLAGLKRFDRIDLVAIINVKTVAEGNTGAVMSPEVAADVQSDKQWKTERRTIVQNAKVIVPAPTKGTANSASECMVAIREEELAGLSDALAKGAKIVCSARSGLPGGDQGQIVDQEVAPPDSITVISGKNSWRAIVPSTKDEDKPGTDEPKSDPK